MSKPVQVYILMGQSNMLGFGKPQGLAAACKRGLYPYLVDENYAWTVRKDVRYVRVMCSGSGPSKTHNNEWMTIKGKIGPEMGIGHYVGHVTKAPVMILKSCIGNRSLGYDLLPPNAPGYQGPSNPADRPRSGPWYAGVQYDGDVAAAKKVLANLSKFYPGARRYQVAGFFWWQGDKDFRNADHANNYERNLLLLFEQLRKDFNAPKARFVLATLGQTRKGAGGNQGKILEAVLNVDGDAGKYRDHKGKVASVYSHPLSKGGSSSGHYGGNAETYQNVGQAMGMAMARLILNSAPGIPGIEEDKLDGTLKGAFKALLAEKFAAANKVLLPYVVSLSDKDPTQVAHARKLHEYLTSLVNEATMELQDLADGGDTYLLHSALAKHDKRFRGIIDYDTAREKAHKLVSTPAAAEEVAAGKKYHALVARQKKLPPTQYFRMLAKFRTDNPDSFYTDKAFEEMQGVETLTRKTVAEINALGAKGDVYAKFTKIAEAKARFAKIPAFDQANATWTQEFKDPAAKTGYALGKTYAKIFADHDKLKARFAKLAQTNAKIRSKRSRKKAEEKAKLQFEAKLKSIAAKLKKLGDAHPASFYGQAANNALAAYINSNRTKLENPLGGK